MGHDMYVWPLRTLEPGRNRLQKDKAAAHLRMTATEGRHSPIYNLFNAKQHNMLHSGDGEGIVVTPEEFAGIKNRVRNYHLSPSEKAFIEKIAKAAPHGFAIFFE